MYLYVCEFYRYIERVREWERERESVHGKAVGSKRERDVNLYRSVSINVDLYRSLSIDIDFY